MRAPASAAILLAAAAATLPAQSSAPIRLVDVAAQAGLELVNVSGGPTKDFIVDANGSGAGWFDYDNDGDLDALVVVNGSTRAQFARGGDPMVALYQNDGRGRFRDVTEASGFTRRGWGAGTCIADYDNDGFRDVYVTAFGADALWRNAGNGTFSDVTRRASPAGAPPATAGSWPPTSSAARTGCRANPMCSTATTATARSLTSRKRPGSSIRATMASGCCSRI